MELKGRMKVYQRTSRFLHCAFAAILLACAATGLGDQPKAPLAPQLNRDALLGHLNAAITWYRDSTNKVHPVGLPSDAIYEDNARSLGEQAVRLAFQSARAAAALIQQGNKTSGKPVSEQPAQQQDFNQIAAKISGQIDDTQQQLAAVSKQLARATPRQRRALADQRDRLQGALQLYKTVQDNIQKMTNFVDSSGESVGGGLEGSINQLAHAVPEVLGKANDNTQKPAAAAKANAQQSALANSSGLIGQAIILLDRVRGMREIDQMLKETDRLRQTAEVLRKPLRESLAAALQRSRDLVNQAAAPASTQPQSARQEFQDLTDEFKGVSNAALPLTQEILVIEQSRANFIEWRRSIVEGSKYVLRALLVRIIGIAIALALVLILSDVWRRLTFRYIHDPRRRRQFLLMRRFVVGFLVGVVLIMGFVSEFSSLATFAGFVTAGIAVGLQAVLLSVAAYFFVVGRYGIRVGERISIAGVTGDVIDIGLVRLYIMELAGTGVDLYPTGRVVVFSNSVLFQAGTPLFKQIPGTEYTWHEVAVPLAPGGNYKLAQERLSTAVTSVHERYRPELERQLGGVERHLEMQLKTPIPETKLQLADTGLELIVRYPVSIRKAAEVDDHVVRAILDVVSRNGDLKVAAGAMPKIRAAIKG
jgi:small-conductance mechanosensitive channel